jgi:hypothetical protein
MDDLNLILTALATGAATGLQQTAGTAMKEAYNGLKALIQRKFANQPKAQAALDDYEDDPDTYEKPLRKALVVDHLDEDNEILAAAQHLITLVQPQQVGTGKYTIQNTGSVQGQVIGDHPNVTQYFGDQDNK